MSDNSGAIDEHADVDWSKLKSMIQTQPRLFWKHDVITSAVRSGVDVDWLMNRFSARLTGWYNAGESAQGALEMILFTWKQEPIELRDPGAGPVCGKFFTQHGNTGATVNRCVRPRGHDRQHGVR